MKANNKLHLVMWESLNGGGMGTIYSRGENFHYRSIEPAIRIPHRLPSGEFGNIALYIRRQQPCTTLNHDHPVTRDAL